MEAASTCPKCGQRREPEWGECPFCGVVYAKAEARRGAAPATATAVGGGQAWSVAVPAAAAAAGGVWSGAAPAAAGWGGPPPPPADDDDLYRPPSAPVGAATRRISDAGLASRGARLAAQLVDGLIGAGLGFALGLVLPGATAAGGGDGTLPLLAFAAAFVALVGINLRLLYLYGQTIGKRIIGVRIVRLDGDRAGLGRLVVLRTMVPSMIAGVPFLGVLFAVVNYLFIFRDDRRCLHDHMADTKVVVA